MEFFRAIVATPMLALLSLVAAILTQRKKATLVHKVYAAYSLFVVIGIAATNLLLLSYDVHSFGSEFGLYLYGHLPFLALLSMAGVWGAVHILRFPSIDTPLKPMSMLTLLFVAAGMFGVLSGNFLPGYDFFIRAYLTLSVVLFLVWFVYRKHKLST